MKVTPVAELRHRVVIEQPSLAPDGLGGGARSWSDYATVWAQVMPRQGAERAVGYAVRAEVSHVIRLRYREGVTPGMRAYWAEKRFSIVAVIDPDVRHVYTDLWVVEGQS